MEKVVARVWGQVLDVPTLRPSDDFVVLGGDSMAAFRAIKLLRIARGGEYPFDMRPEEKQEHVCDRGNGTATNNLLIRPILKVWLTLLTSLSGPVTHLGESN